MEEDHGEAEEADAGAIFDLRGGGMADDPSSANRRRWGVDGCRCGWVQVWMGAGVLGCVIFSFASPAGLFRVLHLLLLYYHCIPSLTP